jgi:hypothetical protein
MALVNPNIAMSFRQPEFTPRNALAEYAQIQQIQGGQRQAEVADMQLESLRRERDALSQIQAAIVAKGGPADLDAAADAMIKTGRPEYVTQGMAIQTARRNQRQAETYRTDFGLGGAPAMPTSAPAAPAMPSSAPGAMAAPAELAAGDQPEPMAPVPGVISTSRVPGVTTAPISMPAVAGEGVRGIVPAVNTLAPPAAASVNAMLAPAAAAAAPAAPAAAPDANAARLRALEAQYRRIGNNPELASERALILKQIEDVQQTIRAESATPSEAKFMRVLGIPLTRQGFVEFEALKRNPTDFERLLSQSGLPKADQTALIQQRVRTMAAPVPGVDVKVNAYVPASEKAQSEYMAESRAAFNTLKNAQPTLDNLEKAKKLIPGAQGFMGPGGQPLLTAASFLNSRLGTSIDTKGVTDTTELRSRLFFGILDNLKKLDSQPTAKQQEVLQEALGSIGTDPAALPRVLDAFGESIRTKVDLYNQDVTEAEARGVRFPYRPQIRLTPPPPVPGAGAAQIPGAPAASTGNAVTLPDGRVKTFPNAAAADQFKKAAGIK